MVVTLISLIAAIFAIVLHEIAHGFAAWRLGDDTAKFYGRLSLNPLKHLDLYGSVVIPGLLLFSNLPALGWAKPVPVNFANLRNQTWALVVVAAAGIITNLILAFVSAVLLMLFSPFLPQILSLFLLKFAYINIILAMFNLLPIPPLDGSKIFFGWVHRPWAKKYLSLERHMLLPIFAIVIILPWLSNQFGFDLLGSYFGFGIEAFFKFVHLFF